MIEIDGEWIRPDFILPELNDLIIEYKGMDDFEYHENQRFSGCRKFPIFVHVGIHAKHYSRADGKIKLIFTKPLSA